jgi:hypothetical protein
MHLGHHSSQEFQHFSLLNNHNYNFNFKNGIPYLKKEKRKKKGRPEITETLVEKYLFLYHVI